MRGIAKKVLRRCERYRRYAVELPQWFWFGLSTPPAESGESNSEAAVQSVLSQKEDHINAVLDLIAGGRFLEVGLGAYPNIPRLRRIAERGIRYSGADLTHVCAIHEEAMREHGVPPGTMYGNSQGTYVWTLFELARRGEKFDAVFLDGHHTLAIDLPAMNLADMLLREGGYLILDDTNWTLTFLRRNMRRSFGEWSFYRRLYDFSEYSPEQQNLPHIALAAQLMLLDTGAYEKIPGLSTSDWWTLRKVPRHAE